MQCMIIKIRVQWTYNDTHNNQEKYIIQIMVETEILLSKN